MLWALEGELGPNTAVVPLSSRLQQAFLPQVRHRARCCKRLQRTGLRVPERASAARRAPAHVLGCVAAAVGKETA